MQAIIDFFTNLDPFLKEFIDAHGAWVYGLLFLIVFCETGLVVTPFLPGDSLLFACGALAARGLMDVRLLAVLLVSAAILGNTSNYSIGDRFGHWIAKRRWLRADYLAKAHAFFERYGSKAVVIAQFAPIVRTFVPFVAGMSEMTYRRFITFNILGALVWVNSFLFAGYWVGNQDVVKRNMHYAIGAIIVVSLLPIAWGFIKARRDAAKAVGS